MENKATCFKDLLVWQKMHLVVLDIYKITEKFPKSEIFGITTQIRRSAVSVAANIAEGFSKKGKADKMRYFNISQGSLEETHYYLILISDLGFFNTEEIKVKIDEVGRMLKGYIRAIENSK
jgi:four helix bundle protein